MLKKKRVLVAMSGGVDSSVAAALLVEQGYEVVGATMQVWDYSKNTCDVSEGFGTCCSSIDVEDARAVADALQIPFYVINCEEPFYQYVIDDFVQNYLQGQTPIPCVHCNGFLKFKYLLQKMKELNCDYLATGHYAKIKRSPSGEYQLITSVDTWKDQTYFLFSLSKEVLPYLMFPVGDWEKPRLREYAEKKGLPVARKKDSTGICFIGKEGHGAFIRSQVGKDIPGPLLRYPSGEKLGEHRGIFYFTYGQRKGLGVCSDRPLYVVKIDPSNNAVWLGEEEYLFSRELKIKNVNVLGRIRKGEELKVKIRFHHAGAAAEVCDVGEAFWSLRFKEPQRAITPGQAAVFYRDSQLLGGGWIC
ncbi:MAG: tRNA 2-thiouridine(34) synthase MnmA [Bdellovibrio sp.]|nr:MAG: tRNA 2-thiouridine(34) synthase MnmA [Bdellovibrio sp.]